MHFLELTLPSLAENLALDEALLLEAEEGGPEMLRIWHWPEPAVVLGVGGVTAADVDLQRCQADGVPVLRRSSGGGTVLLGPGCLLYSVVLAYARHPALAELLSSYEYILGRVATALQTLGIETTRHGSSDLAVADRKVSGNSQQRKRAHLLHHGTLLYAFDAVSAESYLKPPPRQPDYRRRRSHRDFLTNLSASTEAITQALRAAFEAMTPAPSWPQRRVRELVEQKYLSASWISRR